MSKHIWPILFAICILCIPDSSNAQTISDILSAISRIGGKAKNIGTETLIVNSQVKSGIGNGINKKALKINLPEGTKEWYYRITVLPLNSNFNYQSNETLYHLVSRQKNAEFYSYSDKGVNIFIFGHSIDVESFKSGGSSYRFYKAYSHKNITAYAGKCDIIKENMWIGIENPNFRTGLKVIVEVVAFGNYK